jgi:hypothetical protein
MTYLLSTMAHDILYNLAQNAPRDINQIKGLLHKSFNDALEEQVMYPHIDYSFYAEPLKNGELKTRPNYGDVVIGFISEIATSFTITIWNDCRLKPKKGMESHSMSYSLTPNAFQFVYPATNIEQGNSVVYPQVSIIFSHAVASNVDTGTIYVVYALLNLQPRRMLLNAAKSFNLNNVWSITRGIIHPTNMTLTDIYDGYQ